jgi:hypothetical protein
MSSRFNIKEWQDKYLAENKTVKVKDLAKYVIELADDFSDEFDDNNIRKFGKEVGKVVSKANSEFEFKEFQRIADKIYKKYKFKDTPSHMEPGGVLLGRNIFRTLLDRVEDDLF